MINYKNYDVVIVQLEAVHEDVMGGFLRVFEEMGLTSLTIMNKVIYEKRGNFFDTVNNYPSNDVFFHYVKIANDWANIEKIIKSANPKFALFSTLQFTGPARMAGRIDIPIVGIVHNPNLFAATPDCIKLTERENVHLVGLAPHVADSIRKKVPAIKGKIISHFPYEWTPIDFKPKRNFDSVRKICIPGAVNYANRDYESLLKYLSSTDFSNSQPFKINIISKGPDFNLLRGDIKKYNIEHYFDFNIENIDLEQTPHSEYLKNMYDCDVCLPLIHKNPPHYFSSKITTGVMAGIGTGMPIAAQSEAGEIYGFTPLPSSTDSGYAIGDIDMSSKTLRRFGDEILKVKAQGLKSNSEILEPLIKSLCGSGLARKSSGNSKLDIQELTNEQPTQRVNPKSIPYKNRTKFLVDTKTLKDFCATSESEVTFLNFVRSVVDSAAGQHFQDLFGLWHSGLKKNGYFLEFGALNGITASNSYLMEQLGWKGIIAEPHPAYVKHLARRNCNISHDCVWTESGKDILFKMVEGRPALSTISEIDCEDIQEKSGFRDKFKEVKVKTIHLEDLLSKFEAPFFIDYFSIDTEGSELSILESFDFNKYMFGSITVEHNFSNSREKIHEILSSNGYVRKWTQISGHDDWYVHASILSNSVLSENIWVDFVLALPELPIADLHSDRLNRLAETFNKIGDYRSAIDVMESLLTEHGENIKKRQLLAEMQEKSGLLIEAVMNYKRVLDIDPEFQPAKTRLQNLDAQY